MTLPQLYSNISLRSYDYIRYSQRDGRPQGCGMASPFSMGLNGLVSRNVAGYVRTFELCGLWKEHSIEEHAKVGRVPDESMMLNTLVRVAVERMGALHTFRSVLTSALHAVLMVGSWKLNTKMLATIWQGLSQKTTLTRLTVKFPSERHPRPITLVPPMPNLELLHIFDIDPLCYTDDISLLLLGSKKLRDLKLHWNPRMREAREPSINQSSYFGRCAAAQYLIPLRSMAIQNLYVHHGSACDNVVDFSQLQEITFLNSTGGIDDAGGTAFMDGPYRKSHDILPTQLKMARVDKVSRQQCDFLSHIKGLERLYILGPCSRTRKGETDGNLQLPHSPASTTSSPASTDTNCMVALKEDYIDAITKNHGPTLKHLLLHPQWRLTDDEIAIIVRQCPKLEQLGIGCEFSSFKHLRLLVPFLSNLTSLRLLGNPDDPAFAHMMKDLDAKGLHEKKIAEETANSQWSRLRYLELGTDDLIYEVGSQELFDEYGDELGEAILDPSSGRNMKSVWKRSVTKRSWQDVMHIDIWKMDSLDL